ncbi:Hypothetical predicted protein [Cloeon dipterum]|uniref:Dehydrogenase/reductase SDR family member 11 n=1 Tax=Cloeon dipterum TaxID=197152 RepID=A0A8S1E297_9INSE|nr:Hypothetical predicted protein [Cloeon dipterum]
MWNEPHTPSTFPPSPEMQQRASASSATTLGHFTQTLFYFGARKTLHYLPKMERWVGRVAIVSGASSGIGAALCVRLANKGMKVVGVARRQEKIQELTKRLTADAKGEIHALQGDISKEEDIKRVVKWTRDNLGGADVLVNNAGVLHHSPLLTAPTEEWRHVLEVNVLALCAFTREVIQDLRDRGCDDGHIVHINSVMGHYIQPYPGMFMYTASKHSVTVLTEGLRRELSELKSNIRITSVSPALTKTDIMVAGGTPQQVADSVFEQNKSLDPDNVALAVEYTLSAPSHVNIEEITLRATGAD